MILCPKCSFDNEMGRIFCHQCGAKLDLDRSSRRADRAGLVRRKEAAPPRVRGASGASGIEVVLLAVFIWVIYLMTRTPRFSP